MRLTFGLSFCGGCGLGEGRFTSRLFIICGVVMMKITSSTNTRSSNGVMFNSFSELCWGLDIESNDDARREIRGRRAVHARHGGDGRAHRRIPLRIAGAFLPDR